MTLPNLGGRAPLPPVLPQKRAGEEEETDQRGRDPSNGTAEKRTQQETSFVSRRGPRPLLLLS